MNSIVKIFWIVFIVFSVALMGCAGSKSTVEGESSSTASGDDYDEIEQLLGISPEEQQTTTQEQGQDDLLDLLMKDTQTATASQEAQKPAATPVSRETQLENQVEQLSKKIQEKDKTIALLRSQVMSMEEKKSSGQQTVFVSGQSEMTDEEYENNYQYGYNLALNRQYKEAIQVFESLIAVSSTHGLADNAQYWIGECYYALGDYRTAIIAFEKVFTFRQSNKNDYAQYKLGLCYFNLNDRKRAKEEFQNFIDNYQNPALTSKAEEYLAKL
jgi:TolA-binding protein